MKKLLRFAAVGSISTLVDVGLHGLLWFVAGLDHQVTQQHNNVAFLTLKVVTYSIGMLVNFSLNRRWTFHAVAGRTRQQSWRFVVVSLSALALNASIASLVNGLVGSGKKGWALGQLIGTLLAFGVSFIGHRSWTFSEKSRSASDHTPESPGVF